METLNTANPIVQDLTGKGPVVSWLMKDLLPAGAIIVLGGEPGAGKSFLAYTLSFALATGQDVLGLKVPRAERVLYFDMENSKPDRVQYERWAFHGLYMGAPELARLSHNFWCESFTLGGSDWDTEAAKAVEAVQPALIVFDTTTPCCGIVDENDNGAASAAIAAMRQLQKLVTPTPTILALKHAKLRADGEGYTLRGAKAWEGAPDGILFQTRHRGRPRKDGLSTTEINPAKTRAFGLRDKLGIGASWTGADRDGIVLRREGVPPE